MEEKKEEEKKKQYSEAKKKFNDAFEPEKFKRLMLKVAEIFFVVAAFFIIIYSMLASPTAITQGSINILPPNIISGIETFIEEFVGNTFLLIALMEIYEGVVDLEKGRTRTVVDVLDATLSFTLREVIETIYEKDYSVELLLAYATLVVAIGGMRHLISHGISAPTKKEKSS